MAADRAEEPGVAHAVAFPGLSINGFANSAELRHRVRRARRPLEGAASTSRRRPLGVGDRGGAEPEVRVDPGRVHRRVPAAGRAGLGTIGGFKLQIEDRGGLGFDDAVRARRRRSSRQRRADAGARGRVLGLPGQRAADRRQRRPRQGARRRACRSRTSSRRCRCTSARCTSTTSTASAARTRSTPRPTSTFRLEPDDILQLKVRNAAGDDGAARLVRDARADARARASSAATTAIPPPRSTAARRPGFSSGQAQAALEELAQQELPNGMAFEWTELDVPADPRRQHGGLDLPAVRAARVPRARGAVRELVAAARA